METEQILEISERGQITIPKRIRALLKGQFITLKVVEDQVILSPLQTVDRFLDELDEAHQDWKKHGGRTLAEIKDEYEL